MRVCMCVRACVCVHPKGTDRHTTTPPHHPPVQRRPRASRWQRRVLVVVARRRLNSLGAETKANTKVCACARVCLCLCASLCLSLSPFRPLSLCQSIFRCKASHMHTCAQSQDYGMCSHSRQLEGFKHRGMHRAAPKRHQSSR